MLIGFDASRAFVPEATGTENYSLNLLRALAKVDRENRYRVYLRDFSTSSLRDHEMAKQSRHKIAMLLSVARNDKGQDWPANFELRLIRPSRLWTQFGLALETWRAPVDLLFVPAHTLPILRKRFLPMSSRGSEGPVAILKDCFSGFRRIAMTRKQTKYVVTIHDLGVEYLPGYHQFPQRYYLDFASRYAARHADGIIAVSAATKRDLVKRYHTRSKKIFVVHEGVDMRFFKPQSKSKIESVKSKHKIRGPYILFVGTVQPRKNLLMLIKAFGLLVHGSRFTVHGKKKHEAAVSRQLLTDNCQLVLAGKLGWDFQDILAAPVKFGVDDRVKFLGHIPDSDLPALYSGASVFVFPSLFEGFGLPILEALACGCPVVASDIAPHREIYNKLKIESGKLKILNSQFSTLNSQDNLVPIVLAKPNDIRQWVGVLYQYISQYEKRSTYTASRNSTLDLFSWEKTAVDTLQVFRKLLS